MWMERSFSAVDGRCTFQTWLIFSEELDMESDAIVRELAKFIDAVRAAEHACMDSEIAAAFRGAISLAEQFSKSLQEQRPDRDAAYGRLYRLVSDSLPWNDAIVESWNRTMRLWRKNAGT